MPSQTEAVVVGAGIAGALPRPRDCVIAAVRPRNTVLRACEKAEAHPDRAAEDSTSVVIIGGRSSRVEMAGHLADLLIPTLARDHLQLDSAATHITVLARGDRLLPAFHPALSAYATKRCDGAASPCDFNREVWAVDERGVTLVDASRVPASTVVWAGGVTTPAWITDLDVPMEGALVAVEDDMRLAARPDTFVVGGLTTIRDQNVRPVPQVGPAPCRAGDTRHDTSFGSSSASRPSRCATETKDRWRSSVATRR